MVRSLGEKYNVAVAVKKFDTQNYAAVNKLSIQEAARELRYIWFAEIVKGQYPISNPQSLIPTYLLTAHHADDNAETLLMNFCRGTGLHGLTGIPVKAGYIRRPLLAFSKMELLEFANQYTLDFVEDSSNQSSKYTRNLFRNEIIPAISTVYPQVKENLYDNIRRFTEVEKLYKFGVDEIKKKLCKKKGSEIHIPVRQLLGYNNTALIYEIISEYDFSEKQVVEVLKLATSDSGRYISSPGYTYRIIKHRHWFIISPVSSTESENIIIEEDNKHIMFSSGSLSIETTSNLKPQTSNNLVSFDAKIIEFPLLLRKWKTGDYFYPLGMKKKKKVARFLIDQKLSKSDKEKIWVIESNQKIIWIVGHRIDDRVKVTDKTKKVLQISLHA
jgi:tRNA(Ile)-lysidine synthase